MVFVPSCFGGSRLENLQGIPRIMGSRGKINAIWWSIKINLQFFLDICGYELPTNLQNFTHKDLTEVKIFLKVLGGYFFKTPCRSFWEQMANWRTKMSASAMLCIFVQGPPVWNNLPAELCTPDICHALHTCLLVQGPPVLNNLPAELRTPDICHALHICPRTSGVEQSSCWTLYTRHLPCFAYLSTCPRTSGVEQSSCWTSYTRHLTGNVQKLKTFLLHL